ncbi:MAG: hypothetical protein ACIWVG_08200 [Gloeotrichia echinulata HAB0833]
MRLNTKKCQVLYTNVDKQPNNTPTVILNNERLEVVDSYKYLGIHINTQLDWQEQWDKVHKSTAQVPFLLKQLKRDGFPEQKLINIYKSLVLSHFNYSSIALASAPAETKKEMASVQSRALKIMGISKQDAKSKYNIAPIDEHLDTMCLNSIRRTLESAENQLTSSLLYNNRIKLPRFKSSKIEKSAIIKSIKAVRDERYKSKRLKTTTNTPRPVTTEGAKCDCGRTLKNERGLEVHQRSCKRNGPNNLIPNF